VCRRCGKCCLVARLRRVRSAVGSVVFPINSRRMDAVPAQLNAIVSLPHCLPSRLIQFVPFVTAVRTMFYTYDFGHYQSPSFGIVACSPLLSVTVSRPHLASLVKRHAISRLHLASLANSHMAWARQQSRGRQNKQPRRPVPQPPTLYAPLTALGLPPVRREWPSKVAIATYGVHRGYEPAAIDMEATPGCQPVRVDGPPGLAAWATRKGAGIQTYRSWQYASRSLSIVSRY